MPPIDAMTVRPDIDTITALGPSNVPQPTTWWNAAAANWRLGGDDTPEGQAVNKEDAYNQISTSLAKMGRPLGTPDDYADQTTNLHNAWVGVLGAKANDPNAFPNITAKNEAEFDTWVAGRMGQGDKDRWTAAGGGFGTSLVPGLIRGISEPEKYPLMLLGGGESLAGGGAVNAAARLFGIGVLQSAIDAPEKVKAAAAQGQDYTSGEMLGDAFESGVGNVAFGALHYAGAQAVGAVMSKFRATIPAPLQTPEERDALHTLSQDVETQETSPYTDTTTGNAAHQQQLADAIAAIQGQHPPVTDTPTPQVPGAPAPTPTVSPAVPVTPRGATGYDPQIYAGLRARGLNDMQARVAAAASHAEAPGGATAVNPKSGAYGIFQWLGSRKDALFKFAGTEHPTLEQQMDFAVHELRGGHPKGLKVLGQPDEASMLRSFIEDFEVPAKGYETDRDIAAGMKALGRGGEAVPELADAGGTGEGDITSPETLADINAPPVETPPAEAAPVEAPAEVAPTAPAEAAAEAAGAKPFDATPTEPGELTVPPEENAPRTPTGEAAPPAPAAPAAPDLPELRPEMKAEALLAQVRPILSDKSMSLTNLAETAAKLGMDEGDLRRTLDRLVGKGELGQVKKKGAAGKRVRKGLEEPGPYRRKSIPTHGPMDMLKFIARNGGLAAHGTTDESIALGFGGHDLENTGHIGRHFVPGGGKLIQKNGKSLEAMAELLHEEGYFGPPETAPRPTERELIDAIDHSARTGQKVYAEGGAGPVRKIGESGAPEGYQSPEHYEQDRSQWDESAQRVFGRNLTEDEFNAAKGIHDEGLAEPFGRPHEFGAAGEDYDQYLREMVNREADAWIDDAHHETEDERHAAIEQQFRDALAEVEARGAGPDRERSGVSPGDAGGRGEGGEADAGNDRPPALSPAQQDEADAAGIGTPPVVNPEAYAAFDDPFGEGVEAATDSAWHDIEAGVEREGTAPLPEGDTRGQGVQYHGARGELPDLTEGYLNENNIYGGFETFYTTDATDIAGGYQRKRPAGMIYRADEVAPVKTFDMEERIAPEEMARLFGVRDWGDANAAFPASAIEEATGSDGKLNLREAMDEIRDQSQAEGYTKGDVQEVFDTAIHNLSQEGFGAMRHVGGLKTGREPHNVKIYFKAHDQLRLTPLEKAEAPAPTTEAVAQAAPTPDAPKAEPPAPARRAYNPDDYTEHEDTTLPDKRKDWKGVPNAEVSTARTPEGKFTYRYAVYHPEGGVARPFGHGETFDTREEAQAAGLQKVMGETVDHAGDSAGTTKSKARVRAWAQDELAKLPHDVGAAEPEAAATKTVAPAPRDIDAELDAAGEARPPSAAAAAAVDEAYSHPLDNGPQADPAIAERQRAQAQLGAEAPMQAKTDQDSTIGLGLFDAAHSPMFDLEDGKGPRTVGQIAAEFDAEQAAIDAIKGCQ